MKHFSNGRRFGRQVAADLQCKPIIFGNASMHIGTLPGESAATQRPKSLP